MLSQAGWVDDLPAVLRIPLSEPLFILGTLFVLLGMATNSAYVLAASGATLDRTLSAFWVAKSADTNDERDAIMAEFSPRLAAHQDAILMDADLYARLEEET